MHGIPDSLKKRHQEWVEAVNNGNIDAYADLLAEEAVWIPPGSEPITGRKAFKEWLAPFMENYSYEFSITGEKIKAAGNRALERAKFTSRMTPESGGEPMTHSGTFTVLWHRDVDKDGRWYIERYIDDSDL